MNFDKEEEKEGKKCPHLLYDAFDVFIKRIKGDQEEEKITLMCKEKKLNGRNLDMCV